LTYPGGVDEVIHLLPEPDCVSRAAAQWAQFSYNGLPAQRGEAGGFPGAIPGVEGIPFIRVSWESLQNQGAVIFFVAAISK